jgi:hypothetical protein
MDAPNPEAPFADKLAYYRTEHVAFEKNAPPTPKGWITYQLTGVIHVCEMYGEMLARRGRKALRRAMIDGQVPTGETRDSHAATAVV